LTNLSNIALHKPATQSSISKWSFAQNVETDAGIATNGDTASAVFFHTDHEAAPWWQVDLGDCFAVTQVRLFNRRDFSGRLGRFTALVSQTGAPGSWVTMCRKDDNAVFGLGNDIPFVLTTEHPFLARFVRIRKDEPGFLHFRECELLGFLPDADAKVSLRELMEATTRRVADAEREHAAGRTGYTTHIDNRAIFVDTQNYSATMVGELSSGAYEASERRIVRAVLRPTDRVLEIGTAVGVVTMALAEIVGPANVITYDANPAMVGDARRNFAANHMGEIRAEVGVVRNRRSWSVGETEVDFFVSRNFWASRLAAAPDSSDIASVIKVPLVCLEEKIAAHRANVLVCDIEGGEADLLDGADLASIRLIVLEIHYWAVGRPRIDAMIRFLVSTGFNIDFTNSGGAMVVLDREK